MLKCQQTFYTTKQLILEADTIRRAILTCAQKRTGNQLKSTACSHACSQKYETQRNYYFKNVEQKNRFKQSPQRQSGGYQESTMDCILEKTDFKPGVKRK